MKISSRDVPTADTTRTMMATANSGTGTGVARGRRNQTNLRHHCDDHGGRAHGGKAVR
jgi:hypothetical protein